MFDVIISHEAEKYYNRLDKETAKRINKAIEALMGNPLSGPHIKKLRGEYGGMHRFSMGGFRIIYEIDIAENLVTILTIRGRGDVYKR